MFTIMVIMITDMNEPLQVGAVFARGGVRPVWFSWKGRRVQITETTFSWNTREGSARVLHFSVTDGQGLYEIIYNTESLGWRLRSTE